MSDDSKCTKCGQAMYELMNSDGCCGYYCSNCTYKRIAVLKEIISQFMLATEGGFGCQCYDDYANKRSTAPCELCRVRAAAEILKLE